jgi:hypothetical protein
MHSIKTIRNRGEKGERCFINMNASRMSRQARQNLFVMTCVVCHGSCVVELRWSNFLLNNECVNGRCWGAQRRCWETMGDRFVWSNEVITWDVRFVINSQFSRAECHNEKSQLKQKMNEMTTDSVPKTVLRLLVLSAEEPTHPGAHCWPLSKSKLTKYRPKLNCNQFQQIIPVYNNKGNKIKILSIIFFIFFVINSHFSPDMMNTAQKMKDW